MPLKRLFTEHPASVDETYGEHLVMAGGFGLRMILGGIACLIHALLPFLFVRTGSQQIGALHDIMITNRNRKQLAREQAQCGQMPAILDFVI